MADILTNFDARGVATVTLNRPEIHNAFNEEVIDALTACFRSLGEDSAVRAVLLRGAGRSFSTGGDLNWMRRTSTYDLARNRADSVRLAEMFRTLNELPKPTMAIVHGHCFAGGVGLVAACDIAVAAEGALFGLTEVRLGLVPATISPYVIAAIGARACRRYFLTAERFPAAQALRLGLVHEVASIEELEGVVERLIGHILAGGPRALTESKRLIRDIAGRKIDDAVVADTADRIAEARASAEGREGLDSFLNGRQANWLES